MDKQDLLDQIEDMNEASVEIRWRHDKEIKELKEEFFEDLNFELIDLRKGKEDLPEFWIKVYDVSKVREKWEKRLKE